MGGIVSERLALIIDAKTGGAVTELLKAAKGSQEFASAQERQAVFSAKATAAADAEALALAKLNAEKARQSGVGGGKGSAEQLAVAAATDKARLSTLEASAASKTAASSAAAHAAGLDSIAVSSAGATSGLSKLTQGAAAAGPEVAAAIAIIGIEADLALKFLSSGISKFEALGTEIYHVQGILGGTAPQVSLLVGQFNALGLDVDTTTKALFKFASSIGDGSTKLGQYGVTVAKLKDGNTDLIGTLHNVRAAYQGTTDAAERDAIAKAAAAKGGVNVIDYLRATNEQLAEIDKNTRRAGRVISDQDVAAARQLKISTTELKDAFGGLEISVSKGLVPALTEAAKISATIVDVVSTISKYAIPDFGAVFGHGAGKDLAERKVQNEENRKAVDALTKSTIAEYDAERQLASASKAVESAQRAEADAQKSLDKLLKDGAVDAKAVAQATRDVATASKDVERAIDSETKAQQALNKAKEHATALDLEEANLKIADSADAVLAAQEKLDALQGSGSASASELARAQRDVERAQIAGQKATSELTKLKEKGTDADPAVIAAQEAVQNAHENVTAAQDRQRDSLEKLHTVQAGDPDFADKLARAQEAVATAHENTLSAQDQLGQSTYNLNQKTATWNDTLNTTAGNLKQVNDQLSTFFGYASLLTSGQPGASGTQDLGRAISHGYSGAISGVPARASGGPVEASGTYLVGEHGPELLHMGSQGGYVFPGMPASAPNIVVNARSGASAADIAREAAWTLLTMPPPPAPYRP